ncbi:anti-sigma factor [Aquibium sp. LZ166]|uniref:Anti-sigma factor n=1 Tax=Aquibium pacificus TaxID=3153579 RepID=A0ABV3SFH1_9HYPH
MSSEVDRIERAGDYIMGRMTQAERERAERDLERDPKFRETVIRLAERLRSSTQAHQTDLWRSVQESIAGLPQMRDAPLVHPFAPSAAPSQAAASYAPLGGWRGAALIAALVAVGGAGYVAGGWFAGPADPVALVRLSDAEGNTAGILEISEGDALRYLPLDTGQPADGRVLQLWTSFDEAAGPVRLGTVSHAGPLRWRGPHLPPPVPGQTYSVTAASPADAIPGKPFGETLFRGTAERLPRP